MSSVAASRDPAPEYFSRRGIVDHGTFAVFKNSRAREDAWYQVCKTRDQACVNVARGRIYASVFWDYFSMRNGDRVAACALDEITKLFRAHFRPGAKFSGSGGCGHIMKMLPGPAEMVAREIAEVLRKHRVKSERPLPHARDYP